MITRRKTKIIDATAGDRIIVPDFTEMHLDAPTTNRETPMEQLPKITEPHISVGIMAEQKIKFAFDTPFLFGKQEFAGEYEAEFRDGKILFGGNLYDTLLFEPVEPQDFTAPQGGFMLYDVTIGIGFHWQRRENQLFKGVLRIVVEDDRLRVINDISAEAYLYSVISSEMSATAGLELLKAHAVISRSWLLAQKLNNEELSDKSVCERISDDEIVRWYERDAHHGFDVCADDHCQRYQGIGRATTTAVREAIEATRGEVLIYDGKIADARFSKSCGGVSERFENCWADEHHQYLTRVEDRLIDDFEMEFIPDLTDEGNARRWIFSSPDVFCNTHNSDILRQVLNNYDTETPDFFRWKVKYTTAQLSELVARKSGMDFGEIIDLQPLERGVSGRIIRLRIVGAKRTMVVGKELEIRRWLSESHLYSSAFVVDRTEQGFLLTGAGWGHGVGLCQIGAAVMAHRGHDYRTILNHYFPSTSLCSIY